MEEDKKYHWFDFEGEKKRFTENFSPGKQVYKEKLLVKKGIEYRNWEPFRSKLAACIMNGLEEFPFVDKSNVLYISITLDASNILHALNIYIYIYLYIYMI